MTNVEKSELWTIEEAAPVLISAIHELRDRRIGVAMIKHGRAEAESRMELALAALRFLVSAARGEQLPTDEGEL